MSAWNFRFRTTGGARSRASLVAFGALVAGCTGLLGIEDLSTEPRDGAAGAGGSAQAGKGGSGGTGGANGGSAGTPGGRNGAGGSSAKGGTGGTTGGAGGAAGGATGGSAGTVTTGGSAGRGGTGTSGDGPGPGGEGGTGGTTPTDPTVHGTIVDFWGHPLPNLPVGIGDVQTATDDNGEFTIEDVPDEYDVSFIVHWDNPASNYGWVFQGLTRRDPTLQVYRGLSDRYTNFDITQQGGTFTSDSKWLVAFGSDDGSYNTSPSQGGQSVVQPTWTGAASNEWTVHSLFFQRTDEVPASYTAYESQKVPVTEGDGGHTLEMDLTAQDLDSGSIAGTVIQKTGTGRVNSVFVQFTSGGVLPVVDEVDTTTGPYSYIVPQLPNSTITVAAAEDDYNADTFALAHRDGRAVDDAGVDLQIPAHVSPVTPAMGSQNVSGTTQFAFTGGDSDNSGYLIHIEDVEYRQGMYIVTAKKSFKLADIPVVNGGFTLRPDGPHWWVVETHGKFDSTDDMTGADGYLDEFAWDESRPRGRAHGDGSYSRSAAYGFTTAP